MSNFTLKRTGLAAALIVAMGFGASAQTFLYEGIVYKASGNKLTAQAPGKATPENGTAPTEYSGAIVIPDEVPYNNKTYTVTSVGNAFKAQPITSIVMSNTVTTVGIGAFQDCSQLSSVTLSNNLAKLQQNMFTNCTALTEITIPGNIDKFPGSLFKGCTGLQKLTILEGPNPLELTAGSFNEGGNSALKEVYLYHALDPEKATAMTDKPFRGVKTIEKVVLGGNVTELPASYFESCSLLKDVIFESAVTSIGTSAFAGTAIEEITLPNSLETIASGTFSGTAALRKVVLGDAVTTIEALAFQNSGVSDINFPATLETIGDMAFSGSGLSGELKISEGVTRIGAQTFARNAGLTSVSIPAATERIGDGVFMGCPNIAKFSVAAENEKFSTDAEGSFIQSKDGARLLSYAPKAAATTFTQDFVEIAPYAFYGAKNLTEIKLDKCVVFGDYSMYDTGLTAATLRGTVGRYVTAENAALATLSLETAEVPFGVASGCAALATVNLPEKVTVVKQDAFRGCVNLKNLKLGNILAILEADCFAQSGIERLEVASTYPAAMAAGVFTAESNITAVVPVDLVDTYKAADGWSYLTIEGSAALAAGGADMGMPAGLYYAGDDNSLHCVYSDGTSTTYDVGEIPHTFQLLEYSNRIYGASAGRKFVYSATGSTDGDGKLFYISKVGGETFQAVVLDNTGNNAYKDPFGLYIYGEDLYVNDRNVCIRVIPASAIALPQNYPSWMENNWLYFYGAPWSYGCIKCGFAITSTQGANGAEPLFWVGMKYNGNGIFRFRESNIGTAEQAGLKPAEEPLLVNLEPIFTTFNIDEANGHLYLYIENMKDADVRAGLYRVNLADIEANPNPSKFSELNPVLIDGSPVKYEGAGANEHVGISQLAFDAEKKYMYWCYRAPADAEEAALTEDQDEVTEAKGRYYWAEKYDANNPLHHSGIKRILLGQANPTVEMVAPGVSGYGVAVVNYEGSVNPGAGVDNILAPAASLVSFEAGSIVAASDVEVAVYDAAGVMVARTPIAAGSAYALDLNAGVYIVVAAGAEGSQTLKIVK